MHEKDANLQRNPLDIILSDGVSGAFLRQVKRCGQCVRLGRDRLTTTSEVMVSLQQIQIVEEEALRRAISREHHDLSDISRSPTRQH